MADLFYTIASPSEAQYTEKRSKFLGFAFPVSAAAEAKEVVAQMQKRYYDARHVCWAYMLGSARDQFLSNDNGEPSGTAGKPILGQINSLGLTNVLVVVVRYFGGIKLGTSGLIVAYRTAARMALEAAQTVERHDMARVRFHFPYPAMNAAMKLTKDFDVAVVEREFDNTCTLTLEINADAAPALRARIADIDGATLCD
ncbi:MAG: IMPACT family protein [Muribaculaceae bacterium]|nr:IMPACT family protein [Muribaculaceae bacterium]